MITAERIEQRQNGIGGSDAGAILGLNPSRTGVNVFLEKTGQAVPEDLSDNDAVYWGNTLEDVIAQEYSRRTGAKVMRRNRHFTHQDHPFMMANIDRWVVGQHKVLECKTAGEYVKNKWGPSGSDEVPDSYLVQCTHYMIVLGVDVCDLAVLIGGRDFRTYTIGLDKELADIIIEREHTFWHDHVLKRVPPEPTTLDDLKSLYPVDSGDSILAPAEIELAVAEIKAIQSQIKNLEDEKEARELLAKKVLCEKSVLLGIDGKPIATWKKAKDSSRFDKASCEKAHPEIIQQFTVTQPGSRRFLIK